MNFRFPTLILLSFISFSSVAQAPNESNIYYRALAEYIRYVERFEPETDTLYFEELKGITTFFPKEIKGLTIQIITARNQIELYTANGGSLVHRKMTPAQIIDGRLDIGVIPYQGEYSEELGGIRLGLSKWHSVIFEYNPELKKFEYKKLENNG